MPHDDPCTPAAAREAAERIDWLPDGTAWNARFGDRYHSHAQCGLAQAEGVFLRGCGLPAAWAGRDDFRIVETGFGLGLNFLVAWAAWRADPRRCGQLCFVSAEAHPAAADDLLRMAAGRRAELGVLAGELHAAWGGLQPGVHERHFDGGRVRLRLCIGDAAAMLASQADAGLVADAVFLDGFSPARNPGIWSDATLAAVARCSRPGTRLATWTVAGPVRAGLERQGFGVARVPGVPPKRHNLHAVFIGTAAGANALPPA